MKTFAASFFSIVVFAMPASAAWELQKGPDWVVTQASDGVAKFEFSCSRAQPDQLRLKITGKAYPDAKGVMLWIEYPNGRLGRHSVDVSLGTEGELTGIWYVPDLVLAEFQQGRSLEIDMPLRKGEDIATLDMKGPALPVLRSRNGADSRTHF